MIVKIGIDLSTTKTGVVFIVEDENRISLFESYLFDWTTTNKNWVVKARTLTSLTAATIFKIMSDKKIPLKSIEEVKLGIEVSNFGNPELTQKFSRLAGMIEMSFYLIFSACIDSKLTTKIFNANEWYYYLNKKYIHDNNWTNHTREERKSNSVSLYKTHFEMDKNRIITDDISDAFWIAYFWDYCLDTSNNKQVNKKISYLEKKYKELIKKEKHLKTSKAKERTKAETAKLTEQIERLKKEYDK